MFDGRSDEIGSGNIDRGILIENLGSLKIARFAFGQLNLRVERDAQAGREGRFFSFLLQLSGDGELQQLGSKAELQQGDIALFDNALAYRYNCVGAGEVILLRVPAAMLAENLPNPQTLCATRLGCDEGLVATAGAMALTLTNQLREGLDEVSRQRVANHLLGMISSCYMPALDGATNRSSLMASRLWRVKIFIEQNLRNPKLSPALVAAQLKLSPRYLRMIFAGADEPILAYILRRRLEECAARLADQQWRGHSITEIAFSFGFNSAPHFTRTFRERFSLSPREYRQKQVPCGDRAAA